MDNKQKIKVSENGPYIVTGGVPLDVEVMECSKGNIPDKWSKSRDIKAPKTYSLCRCGRSDNKPFCDGSHAGVRFNGTETAKRKPFMELAEKNTGPQLDLYDAECFCSIARFCHRAGDAWNLTNKSNDPKAKATAIQEAADCPSGRLVAFDKSGKPIEPGFSPSISVTEDPSYHVSGPLWVKGGIQIESEDGYQYEIRNRATLCRCGASKGKPFCDGTHIKIKFSDGDSSIKKK